MKGGHESSEGYIGVQGRLRVQGYTLYTEA